MDDDPRIKKAMAALDDSEKLLERALKQIDEARSALTAEVPQSVVVGKLFSCFAELWKRRYQSSYTFTVAKDGSQLKRLLKAEAGIEIARRMKSYLADVDPFVVQAKHPLGLFVSRFNRYANTALPLERELTETFNCNHRPPCRNDAAHTKRMMTELRS